MRSLNSLGATILAGTLAVLGCGGAEDTAEPTSTSSNSGGQDQAGGSGTGGADSGGGGGGALSVAVEVIGPEGGVIHIDGLTLSIPQGALAQATEISVEKLAVPPAEFSAWVLPTAQFYEFGPDGLTFAKEVEVRLDSPPDDEEIGAIWTEGGELSMVPHERDGDVVIARSNHFSTFGFGSWRHVAYSFWAATTILVSVADVGIAQPLQLLGAVEMALLCKAKGRGDAGQPPCDGPRNSNNGWSPLCFGPGFAKGGDRLKYEADSGTCEPVTSCETSTTSSSTTRTCSAAETGLVVSVETCNFVAGQCQDYERQERWPEIGGGERLLLQAIRDTSSLRYAERTRDRGGQPTHYGYYQEFVDGSTPLVSGNIHDPETNTCRAWGSSINGGCDTGIQMPYYGCQSCPEAAGGPTFGLSDAELGSSLTVESVTIVSDNLCGAGCPFAN